jgi:putative MATE family efflux protein
MRIISVSKQLPPTPSSDILDLLEKGDNMDFRQKRELILKGPMTRVILTLSLPMMINNFIQTIYNLTDTYFVSRIGGNEVAAIQFTWPMMFFMMSFGIGFSMAATSLMSQYIGAHDDEKAQRVGGQILLISLVFSTVVGIAGGLLSRPILSLMGIDGDLLANADAYLSVMFYGMPGMFMIFAYNGIRNGQGDTLRPMILSAFSVGLNILLDPIFIFTLGMGVRGAAIATVISRVLFGALAVTKLFFNRDLRISLEDLVPDPAVIRKITGIGLPSSVGQSTAALGFAVLNVFIVSFGESTLTAFAIGNRISSLVLMPAMGIGSALASIVGQNLGADQVERSRASVKKSAQLTTLFLAIGGSVLLFFARDIVDLFANTPEQAEQSFTYMRLIVISLPLMGFFQIFIGVFQGSGHTMYALAMMMGRLWALRIPMILLFKTYTDFGPNGVWYAMVLSNLLTVLFGLAIYLTGRWEHKVIKKSEVLGVETP